MRKSTLLAAHALTALLAAPAASKTDPAGDFLMSFTGTPAGELDFIDASAVFDGTHYALSFTLAGAPTGSANVLHVWGIDRGAGTARLNLLFDPDLDPDVKWDALAVLFGDGTLRVVAFPPAGPPAMNSFAGAVSVNGATVTTAVPLSLLPSRGFVPEGYRFQLWSRLRADPAADGPNTEIADFGPRITAAVPEPATWAMMVAGFALAGGAMRRRTSLNLQMA